jgi:HD-GYP domain-containing protein (c-di-GMP phosphodiesterase class II)
MIEEIKIETLRVGHFVVEIVQQQGKYNLNSAGYIKHTDNIKNLSQKGVISVNIDNSLTKTITCDKKSSATKAQKPTMIVEIGKAKALFNESKALQKKMFADAQQGKALSLDPVVEVTNKTIDAIFDNASALACVINIRKKDEYLLEHSVSVSVLITIFARFLAISRDIVEQLAVGAFLHDVGKIMIPEAILNKPSKLTDDEFTLVKTHVNHSINIIEKTPNISAISLEIAALHHEKLDGNGYPHQVKGDNISQYGRMIAICDIFDALIANRSYKQGFSHPKAFGILRNLALKNHLDSHLVDSFIKCMGVYPIGSLVELSSNKLAIVEAVNEQNPTKPKVRSFYSRKDNRYEHTEDIDLSLDQDSIVKGVRADDFDLDMEKIIEFIVSEG